ncbi:MAG TPA: hypothetical protein VKV26_07610 [Dehalococcoidia bacterium]|nr:hypothetical protein [Dehalococcoidia bacterium]
MQGYLLPPFGLTVAPQLPAGGVADKTSRPHLSDIPIVKYVDKASPKLF